MRGSTLGVLFVAICGEDGGKDVGHELQQLQEQSNTHDLQAMKQGL